MTHERSRMTILILGGPDDEHAAHIYGHLRGRGRDTEYLDSRSFPAGLTVAFDPIRDDGWLRLPTGRRVGWQAVSAVYWRSYPGVGPVELPDAGQAMIAGNDARGLFESLLMRLPARWVNGWDAFRLHQTKPAQLAMVAEVGLPTPATMLGNDPEAVRAFAAEHPRCVFKPIQGGAHTRRLTAQHLSDAALQRLALAPVTIQEEVPGTDIRVFVVGDRVLACEVRTDSLDFRDDPDPRIVPCELPADVADGCRKAARALHLLWTGIDLRRTPDGRFVFLEANPSPMFLGFEERSGLPLTAALAELLLEPRADRPPGG